MPTQLWIHSFECTVSIGSVNLLLNLPVVPNSNGFHEVPVSYVRQIQSRSGEFFNLLKLLPKNMSFGDQLDDPIILTLEDSVIKAKKVSQPSNIHECAFPSIPGPGSRVLCLHEPDTRWSPDTYWRTRLVHLLQQIQVQSCAEPYCKLVQYRPTVMVNHLHYLTRYVGSTLFKFFKWTK